MNDTALLIVPYFGTLPPWIPFWLRTCAMNPRFKWLVITDDEQDLFVPGNVEIRHMSFDAYKEGIARALDISVERFTPYKLCDLKPFYGIIHRQDIEGFPFWGWCDLDVLFGDLDTFFPPRLLERYHFFSTHRDRLAGHFCLLRNTPDTIGRCFRIRDWKRLLEADRHLGIDELQYGNLYFALYRRYGRDRGRAYYDRFSFMFLEKLLDPKNCCRELYTTPLTRILWHDGTLYWDHPLTWIWEDGRLFSERDGFNVPYMHFMNYKGSPWFANGLKHAKKEHGYIPRTSENLDPYQPPWPQIELQFDCKGAECANRLTVDLHGIRIG